MSESDNLIEPTDRVKQRFYDKEGERYIVRQVIEKIEKNRFGLFEIIFVKRVVKHLHNVTHFALIKKNIIVNC